MESTTSEWIIETRIDVDPDIIELYTNTSLTVRQIAERLGISICRANARVAYLIRHGEVISRKNGTKL